jgi:hypothetical protein
MKESLWLVLIVALKDLKGFFQHSLARAQTLNLLVEPRGQQDFLELNFIYR